MVKDTPEATPPIQEEDGALRFQRRIREVLAKYNIALPLAAEEMLAGAMCRMSRNV
jgi:hypothetical protein